MTATLIMSCVLALAVGLAIDALALRRKDGADVDGQVVDAQVRAAGLEGELAARTSERDTLRIEVERLRERTREDAAAIERARAEAEQAQRARSDTEAFVRNAQEQLSAKFTELAGKAFHERG